MARNLYDLGDRPRATDAWLNEKQERSSPIVPRGALLVALLLGGVGMLVLRDVVPGGKSASPATPTAIVDQFAACDDPTGAACLLSADRYAWRGRTYRVADIRTPSLANARCAREADLARASRVAMLSLMNGGAFDARPVPADDQARLLVRDGVSLGSLLILKGHARPAGERAGDWCTAP